MGEKTQKKEFSKEALAEFERKKIAKKKRQAEWLEKERLNDERDAAAKARGEAARAEIAREVETARQARLKKAAAAKKRTKAGNGLPKAEVKPKVEVKVSGKKTNGLPGKKATKKPSFVDKLKARVNKSLNDATSSVVSKAKRGSFDSGTLSGTQRKIDKVKKLEKEMGM